MARTWHPAAWLLLLAVASACTSPEQRRRSAFDTADALLARGDRRGAQAALEGLLVRDPRDVAAVVRLAELDLEEGRYGTAMKRLASLPSGVPKGDEFFAAETRALVHVGPLEQALARLLASAPRPEDADPELVTLLLHRSVHQRWLDLPALPDAWRQRRAELLVDAGHLAEARAEMRRLPAGDARSQLLEQLIQAALTRDELALLGTTEEIESEPPSPWKLLARHSLLLQRGDEGAAAEVERQFLRRYPRHPQRYDVLVTQAQRENRSGSAETALRLADEALHLRPSQVAPLLEKALALRSLGRRSQAEGVLELVLAIDGDNHLASRLLERGDAQRRRDQEARSPRLESLELRIGATDGG